MSTLPTLAGGALCPTARGSEPETAPCAARLGGGVGFLIYRSDTAVYVLSAMFLPALLHPRVPFSDGREPCFCRKPSSLHAICRHLAFALEMLAKYFVHKSCKERMCLVPFVCTAGSLSETLRLSSKSWNPELLCISRGQFIFSNTYLQFNYAMIQIIPLFKPGRRENSTPLQLFIFLFYLLLCIMA